MIVKITDLINGTTLTAVISYSVSYVLLIQS